MSTINHNFTTPTILYGTKRASWQYMSISFKTDAGNAMIWFFCPEFYICCCYFADGTITEYKRM